MKTEWIIGLGLAVFLTAPPALASEPEGDAAREEVQKKKQVKTQDQKKAQEKKQEQERSRDRHGSRHRTGEAAAQGAGEADVGKKRKDGGEQFVDTDGDGIHDGQEHRFRGKHRRRHRRHDTGKNSGLVHQIHRSRQSPAGKQHAPRGQ